MKQLVRLTALTLSESSLRRAWESPRFRLLIYEEMISAAPEEIVALLAKADGISPAEMRRPSSLRAREEWLPREINRSGREPVRVEEADDFIRLLKRARGRQNPEEGQGGFQLCAGSEITASIYASTGSREVELEIALTGDLEATLTSSLGPSATVEFSRGGIKRKVGAKLDLEISRSLGDLSSRNGSTRVLLPDDFVRAYEHLEAQRHREGFYLSSICLGSQGASFKVRYGNNAPKTFSTSGSVQLKGIKASLSM